MKVYAVSDLHGNLDGLDPCDADLVIIAGDFAPMKGWGVWHVNDQVKSSMLAEAKTWSRSHSNSTKTLRRKRGRGFTSTESLLSRAH